MRVLVTGASGFVGPHIVNRLLLEDCEVVALVRRTSDVSGLKRPGVTLVMGDLREETVLKEAMKDIDVVVHAAVTVVGNWEHHHEINVRAMENLLELSRSQRIRRFVFISSISVYPFTGMEKGQLFSEDMPFEEKELSKYARSKIEGEKLLQKYHAEHGLSYAVVRPGSIYGPGGSLFPAMTGLALGDSRILLIGNGKGTLPLSYVENVADAVWLCIDREHADGRCYNLVEEDTLTRTAYLNLVRERVQPRLSVIKLPYFLVVLMKWSLKTAFGLLGRNAPLGEMNLRTYREGLRFSTERARRDLREKPYVDFALSLDRTMEWQKAVRTPKRAAGLRRGKVVIPSGKQLRAGIVGCGGISGVHLSTLRKMKNVRLTALADIDRETREGMAKQFGVPKTYPDVESMLENESLDVVHVLTPPQTHAEVAIAAMSKGCHVLVEKPMAATSEEAERMIRASEEYGVKLCVGHNILYDEVMLQARDVLAAGQVGRIVYAESWYGIDFNPYGPLGDAGHWIYGLPGKMYQDYLIHPLYLLLDVLEGATEVDVTSRFSRTVPHMDTDELRIVLQGEDRFGILSLSTAVSPRYSFLNVYGTSGTLRIDFLNKYVFLDTSPGMLPKTLGRSMMTWKLARILGCSTIKNLMRVFSGRFSLTTGADRLIRLFYRSILLGGNVPVPGPEGLRAMQIMDAVWKQVADDSRKG